MKNINAYLSFNGQCREAMNFYQQTFGGELTIMTFGESPMAENTPAEAHDNVLHSCLINGDVTLMASDMAGPEGFVPGNTVSLMISCSSHEEITDLFSKLSSDGTVTCPLGEQFWGSTFASLTDKFGINWLLEYSKSEGCANETSNA